MTSAWLLLHGGRIYTRFDPPHAVEALLLHDGLVQAAGDRGEVEAAAPRGVHALDLGARVVLPGLIDAHLHLEQLAWNYDAVDADCARLEEVVARVQARAAARPAGSWILGHGWNQTAWGRFGTAAELDSAAPAHPVYLTARSLHAGWANRAALARAGITAGTPDPPDGVIPRDAAGHPTGILLEGAMRLMSEALPQPTPAESAEQIARAQETLWTLGLTGVHDFDGHRCLEALRLLRGSGRLGLRVVKQIRLEDFDQGLAHGLHSGAGDAWIRIGHLKLFADGALGPRTAAMLEPYDGEPHNRGLLLLEAESLAAHGRRAAQAGLALAIHAIGDRANRAALNALEALTREQAPPLPHRIEHVQLIDARDQPRLAALGITASMQPIHAPSDRPMADRYWGDRVRYAYAWNSQRRLGARLAFGSDAPVESPSPLLGLHAAVTRRGADGQPGPEGWVPEERLTAAQTLEAYTAGPARAVGLEPLQGRLEPGSWADLVVLGRDPLATDPDELARLAPEATMVDGEWRVRRF